MGMPDNDREDPGINDEDEHVILTDADGNETEFLILGIIEVEDEDFALLTLADADQDESLEVFIFHYEADGDGIEVFRDVEDQVTFDKVRAAAEELFETEETDETDET